MISHFLLILLIIIPVLQVTTNLTIKYKNKPNSQNWIENTHPVSGAGLDDKLE